LSWRRFYEAALNGSLQKENAMHKHLTAALVGFGMLVLNAAARADDATDAKIIVEKAIKALGGAEKLNKFTAATFTMKGTFYGAGDGNGFPFTATYAVRWPDQMRFEVEGAFVFVLDGDKGWTKMGDETKEMSKDEQAYNKAGIYVGWVERLAPLLDKEFTLSKLEEIKVDGKPTVGVKVARKGQADVSLYFDKDTFLLAKSSYTVKDPEHMNKEVAQESFYKDYKEADGIKTAMKIVDKRDGKPYVEAEMSGLKNLEKVDAKLFAKP
jgi:hypothetical protein